MIQKRPDCFTAFPAFAHSTLYVQHTQTKLYCVVHISPISMLETYVSRIDNICSYVHMMVGVCLVPAAASLSCVFYPGTKKGAVYSIPRQKDYGLSLGNPKFLQEQKGEEGGLQGDIRDIYKLQILNLSIRDIYNFISLRHKLTHSHMLFCGLGSI